MTTDTTRTVTRILGEEGAQENQVMQGFFIGS